MERPDPHCTTESAAIAMPQALRVTRAEHRSIVGRGCREAVAQRIATRVLTALREAAQRSARRAHRFTRGAANLAQSLPENTVDAWTAIELAKHHARWIWLPTTNQGGTVAGSHPGDVSTLLGRRLVIIENKGVKDNASIAFGGNGHLQRSFLLEVEEAGLRPLPAADVPQIGWVFFGLPLPPGPTTGQDWRSFPSWHHLMCPHTLNKRRVGQTSATMKKIQKKLTIAAHPHRPVLKGDPAAPLLLNWLHLACDAGLAGLPFAQDPVQLDGQLRDLLQSAREATRTLGLAETSVQVPEDTVFDLLGGLATEVRRVATNPTVGIF